MSLLAPGGAVLGLGRWDRVLGLCLMAPLNWFHLSQQDSQDLKLMCLSLGSVLGAVPAAAPKKSSLQGRISP